MTWMTENWLWILFFAAFVAMHLLGHGGHGSPRKHEEERKRSGGEPHGVGPQVTDANASSGGHHS